MTLQQKITDALRFWEPARIVYNLLLAVTVLVMTKDAIFTLPMEAWAGITVLALLANIAYSAAYVPDIFVQSSDFAPLWRQFGRPVLWFLGTLAAFVIAFAIVWSEQGLTPAP